MPVRAKYKSVFFARLLRILQILFELILLFFYRLSRLDRECSNDVVKLLYGLLVYVALILFLLFLLP